MTTTSQLPEQAAKRPVPGSAATQDKSHLEKIGWGKSKDKFRMDNNKLLWHKDRLQAWTGKEWKGGEHVIPLHIDMGIATGCNLGCKYCYGIIQAREGFLGKQGMMKFMPLETIKNVFSDAKEMGVRSIAIIGEGENTLNPALYPALDHAREIDLDVSLATHGANITERHVKTLVKSLKWLRINISAATPEAYMNIHQTAFFDRVMNATKLLVEAKKKYGSDMTLGYQMVITKENMDQIVPLAKLGREMGVDYTVFKACSDTPDRKLDAPDKEYLDMVDVFKEAEAQATDDYTVVVRWNKLGNEGNKDYAKCHGTRFIIAMSGDGTVFPCGHWFDIERERFNMGNVNKERLKDIFTSERYWNVQNEIHKVDLRNCETNCRQHSVNQTLYPISIKDDPAAYVESLETPSKEPNHVNFV